MAVHPRFERQFAFDLPLWMAPDIVEPCGAPRLDPRLRTPMRLIDLGFFVAEHDDHHLARITELLKTATSGWEEGGSSESHDPA